MNERGTRSNRTQLHYLYTVKSSDSNNVLYYYFLNKFIVVWLTQKMSALMIKTYDIDSVFTIR